MSRDIVAGPAVASVGGPSGMLNRVAVVACGFGAARGRFGVVGCEPHESGRAAGVMARAGADDTANEDRFEIQHHNIQHHNIQHHRIQDQLRLFLPAAAAPLEPLATDPGLLPDRGLVVDRGRSP